MSKSNNPKKLKIKTILYVALASILVISGIYSYMYYQATAPERVVAAFYNDLASHDAPKEAYVLTSSKYQKTVSYNNFLYTFKPLEGSYANYSIVTSKVLSKVNGNIVAGYLYDLNGKNFEYIMHLVQDSNNQWQIQYIIINKI